MADPDVAHPRRQLFDKCVVNAVLDEQPAGRGAALAVQRKDHEDGGVQSPVKVCILEHDHRVLATQFKMHPLQGRCSLGHDFRSGRRFADEGDRLDRLVLGQRDSGILAEPVHQIVRAFGQSGFLADLG